MVINLRQRKQKFNLQQTTTQFFLFACFLLVTIFFSWQPSFFQREVGKEAKVSNTFIVLIPRRVDRKIVPLKCVSFRYFVQDVALA